jgi:hypothetical protein
MRLKESGVVSKGITCFNIKKPGNALQYYGKNVHEHCTHTVLVRKHQTKGMRGEAEVHLRAFLTQYLGFCLIVRRSCSYCPIKHVFITEILNVTQINFMLQRLNSHLQWVSGFVCAITNALR